MNITTQTVLHHFLLQYIQEMEQRKIPEMNPFFDDFFTREELIKILNFMFGGIGLTNVDLETARNQELLDVIHDERYILGYFLNQWKLNLQERELLSAKAVYSTLEQLGNHTHYLGQKNISDWDSYDKSNYRALQVKAGKLTRVYGIYDVDVSQDDVYIVDSPPKRFYETQEKAQLVIDELIRLGISREKESHILYLYKAI